MPDQLNPNGTLFGGTLMGWIDMAAYMCAERHSGTSRVVTACVEQLDFVLPLKMGDHVVLTSLVDYAGRTSMSIRVTVEKENTANFKRETVARTYLTFVALDPHGKPQSVPPVLPTSAAEELTYSEAAFRWKLMRKFRSWWNDRQRKSRLALTL